MTGYLVEKSLSVDNLFVFLVVFQFFAVPAELQPKALRWGIVGALVFRFVFILSGATLLNTFHWMVFLFGAVLLFAAYRLARQNAKEVDPARNPVLKLFRRVVPVTRHFHDNRFFLRLDSTILATPLFVAVIAIETTDIVFAVDSVPAVLAITSDPFIVFTSNAFAILGLRALYFVLADIMHYFRYLRYGLVAILGLVGAKMMVSPVVEVPTAISLGVICAILTGSIGASLMIKKPAAGRQAPARRTVSNGDPGKEVG